MALKRFFGDNITSTLLIIIALTGLVASFHTIIYAYGRVLFALSRAGYIPRWISVTGKNHTPVSALILGGIVGLGCAWMIAWQGGEGIMAAALLNMAVFGAVLSYAMVMASYIKLHFTHPHLKRPYRSPFGVPGAVVGLFTCTAGPFINIHRDRSARGDYGNHRFFMHRYCLFLLL